MSFFDRLDRHAGLVHAMAARTGTDLTQAMMEGRLAPDGLRAAVLRCTGCVAAGDCEKHLASEGDDVPGYCRNARLFAALAPE